VAEDLVNAIGLANEGNEVLDRQVALLHDEFDGCDGVGKVEREMASLLGLHQRHQDIQPVALGRVALGAHQALNRLQRRLVVPARSDRFDLHSLALLHMSTEDRSPVTTGYFSAAGPVRAG
jgi:hypothetical protein